MTTTLQYLASGLRRPPFTDSNYSTFENIVLNILSLLVILVFVGAVYSLIRAVFQFVFSGGNNENIQKAGNNIKFVLIGLLIVIFMLFTAPIINDRLNLPGTDAFKITNVFERVTNILSFGFSNESDTANDIRIDTGGRGSL